MQITFKLTGDKALDRKFAGLDMKVQKKVLRQSIRAAAKIILPAEQAATPIKSGRTRGQLKIRATKRTRKGRVGVNVMTSAKGGGAYYDPFVDLGTKHIAGRRYRLRAFEASRAQALNVAMNGIRSGIEQQATTP